ncbi:MAG: stage III sporulation protein AA [Clostridia bacterium]
MEEVLQFLPEILREKIKQININNIEEIRIRTAKPVILKNNTEEKLVDYITSSETVLQILQKICDNSLYSYQNQICEGFITIKKGHRVGITGNAVIKDGKVITLSYISSLNFRIARQILDCSNKALKYILNNNKVWNTLIVSPPGLGKTTLLKDIIRKISNGIPEMNFKGITCSVVDERGEISATYKGISQNDLGIRTDVIDNIPKALGMKMLIRSMSPKVIIADEIGSKEDIEAIEYAVSSGVNGIFTAHGESLEQIKENPILNQLILKNYIDKILILDNQRNIHLVYDKINQREAV